MEVPCYFCTKVRAKNRCNKDGKGKAHFHVHYFTPLELLPESQSNHSLAPFTGHLCQQLLGLTLAHAQKYKRRIERGAYGQSKDQVL